MEMSIVCDTYLPEIIDLRNELDVVCQKVNEKYKYVRKPLDLLICYRCLPDEIGRKTFRRYDKEDEVLTLDITLSYEEYLPLLETERRHKLGHTFFNYLKYSLKKYKFEEINVEEFLFDIKNWCNKIGWLED